MAEISYNGVQEAAEKQIMYHIFKGYWENLKEWRADDRRAYVELIKTTWPFFVTGKMLGARYGIFLSENFNFSTKILEDIVGGYYGQLLGGLVGMGGKHFFDKLHSKSL